MTQAQINRLVRLEQQATRLGHLGWAADLHQRWVIAVRQARHDMWLLGRAIRSA